MSLIHGGLRLCEGYMAVHRRQLAAYIQERSPEAERVYRKCLRDTFGPAYIEHLDSWIAADGEIGGAARLVAGDEGESRPEITEFPEEVTRAARP